MRLAWIMHEEIDLLNGISNVRASQSEILKSTGKTAIQCRICNRRTIGS
jgi:hypothetical protein